VVRHLQGQGRLGPPSPQRSTTAPVRCTVSQAMPSRSLAASRLPLLPAPWTVLRTLGGQSTLERGG
jgi:hypothetical protein